MAYGEAFNLFSLGAEKDFKFWKFHSYCKVIYQVSENRDIVEVPAIIMVKLELC